MYFCTVNLNSRIVSKVISTLSSACWQQASELTTDRAHWACCNSMGWLHRTRAHHHHNHHHHVPFWVLISHWAGSSSSWWQSSGSCSLIFSHGPPFGEFIDWHTNRYTLYIMYYYILILYPCSISTTQRKTALRDYRPEEQKHSWNRGGEISVISTSPLG